MKKLILSKRVVEKLQGEEINILARLKGRVKLRRCLVGLCLGRKHELELCFVTLDETIEEKGRVMECGSAISSFKVLQKGNNKKGE